MANNNEDEGFLDKLKASKGAVALIVVLALGAIAFLLPRESSQTVSQRTGAVHVTWKVLGATCYDSDKQTDVSKWVAAQGLPVENDRWIFYGGKIRRLLGGTVGKAPKPAADEAIKILETISKSDDGKALLEEYYALLDETAKPASVALMTSGKKPAAYKLVAARKQDKANFDKLAAFKQKVLGTGS